MIMTSFTASRLVLFSALALTLTACEKEDIAPAPSQPTLPTTSFVDSTRPYVVATYDPNTGVADIKSLPTLYGERVFFLRDGGSANGFSLIALDTLNLRPVDSITLPPEMHGTTRPYVANESEQLIVSSKDGTISLNPLDLQARPHWYVPDVGALGNRVLRRGHLLYAEDYVDAITRRLVELDLRDGSHRDALFVRDDESRRGKLIGPELSGLAIAPHADGHGDILYAVYRRHDEAIKHVPNWNGQNRQDVYAVDLATGRQLWMAHDTVIFAIPNSSSTVYPNAVFDSVLIVRTSNEYVGLNRFTGSKLWGIELAERYGWRDAQGRPVGYTGHSAEPEVGDGVIAIFPTGGRHVVAGVDPYTGQDLWRNENIFEINIHKSERLPGGDRINLGWGGGALQRYDPQTGALRWKVRSPMADSFPEGTFTLGFHLDTEHHAVYIGDHYRFFKLRIPQE